MSQEKDLANFSDADLLAGVAHYITRKSKLYAEYKEEHTPNRGGGRGFWGSILTLGGMAASASTAKVKYDAGGSLGNVLSHLPNKEAPADLRKLKPHIDLNFEDSVFSADGSSKAKAAHDKEAPTPRAELRISDEQIRQIINAQESKLHDARTFSQMVVQHMIDKKLEPTEIYKPLGMDRRLFSKICNTKDYHPKRETALGLGLALHLNLEEFTSFINRAGYAVNGEYNKLDWAIEFFIEKEIYDIARIDNILVKLGLPTIGKY